MGDKEDPKKKCSIDEIIEHMTTDIQVSDGQYVPLGFTSPPTPFMAPAWTEYKPQTNDYGEKIPYCPHQPVMNSGKNPMPVFLSDVPNVCYGVNTSHLGSCEVPRQQNFYYGTSARQPHVNVLKENPEVIGTVVDGGGNIVRVVYSGSNVSTHPYHIMTCENADGINHSYSGFHPYQRNNVDGVGPYMKDCGLFDFAGNEKQQQPQRSGINQPQLIHDTEKNRAQLIENFVGNWVPNQSGTYSPFGCTDNRMRQMHSVNQQGIQTEPVVDDPILESRGAGHGIRKTRIVAEVRPMRPSYSDVLSKSAPISAKSCSKSESPTFSKTKVAVTKSSNGKRNNKSSSLKRQYSSSSDDHCSNGAVSCNKTTTNLSNKSVGNDAKHNNASVTFNTLPRKWVSLDDLDTDIQKTELDEEVFQPMEVLTSESLYGDSFETISPGANKKSFGTSASKSKIGHEDAVGTTLNNRKPSVCSSSGKGPRPPNHINNNLGTSSTGEKNILKGTKNYRNCPEDRKGVKNDSKTSSGGVPRPGSSRYSSNNMSGSEKSGPGKRRGRRKESQSSLALLYRRFRGHVTHWGRIGLQVVFWFLHLLSDVFSMSGRLFVHLCALIYDWLCMWSVHAWKKVNGTVLRLRLLERLGFEREWWYFWKTSEKNSTSGNNIQEGFPPGLEHNISLPATGEEAMRRLLSCKGKDPYSILGVTPNCTDDDIKKYYKRQAVLVHPDKNNQPGAEEAFKILVHAFEVIGEPERRMSYDKRVAESHQVEQAWSELSDLLSQLHKKMEYAANTIRCTNCGKRHRRIRVERPCYAARFCSQCKIHHNAREGDIWAESTMLGFLWHYYACMDGGVYDITEWAACQANNLRHLRANTHTVQYRIVLGKQSQQQPPNTKHQSNKTSHRNVPETNSEPDLEDFLSNLYSQPGPAGEGGRSEQARVRKRGKKRSR